MYTYRGDTVQANTSKPLKIDEIARMDNSVFRVSDSYFTNELSSMVMKIERIY